MGRTRRRWWASEDDAFQDLALVDGGRPEDVSAPPFRTKPPEVGGEDALNALANGEIVHVRPIPWGSNYSFVVQLECDGQPKALAVYKPQRGEVPLWDFPDGTLYRREYAAYLVARWLDMHFVPPTVIRDGPHGVGTFQLFVEPDDSAEYYQFRSQHVEELRAIALFDVVTNNADRKAGHCFKGRDGRIWAIDHGLCFNVVPKLRTVIWDFCGQVLPPTLAEALLDACTDPARTDLLRAQLGELLHRSEIEAFFTRLERVAERGELPTLDPYRNVPRGFW